MVEAQKIACTNNAGFVMSFVAQTQGGRTDSSGSYPINQTQVIDLGDSSFREGLEFWPLVDAALGKTQASPDHITFRRNGQTATYEVTGTTQSYSIKLIGQPVTVGLPDFPAGVPLNQSPFQNWAGDLTVPSLWTCAPRSPQDVVDVCNWAKDHGFTVRPRGWMHGWSPLSVTSGADISNLLMVDLTKALTNMSFQPGGKQPPQLRVQTGARMLDVLAFLEEQPGGSGPAPGYSFPHTPAPGNLTVGGVIAINAHGTAIPTLPVENFQSGYGSMSNHILELTAIVTDPRSSNPGQYLLRTFKRGEGDDKAFLTHLGRGLITEVVLQVIDNYNLRCQSITDLPASTVFATAGTGDSPPNSFADFLNRNGRVEVIWFPFTANPWLHIWTVSPQKPDSSRKVDGPYNYPFADNLDPTLQAFLQHALSSGTLGLLTPEFGQMMYRTIANGLDGKNFLGMSSYAPSRDIWGPSKNTLVYIQDPTLKVTANGYAVQMRKADIQNAVHDFTAQFSEMLARYQAQGKFPINSPLEIRVTGLDDPAAVGVSPGQPAAKTPVISSLTYDEVAKANQWDVALWLDVLTIPGTPACNDFFEELENWLLIRFKAPGARVLPEWSKGWAYTAQGPWTNTVFVETVRQALTTGRTSTEDWNWEIATLQQYDGSALFTNAFLKSLLVPVPRHAPSSVSAEARR